VGMRARAGAVAVVTVLCAAAAVAAGGASAGARAVTAGAAAGARAVAGGGAAGGGAAGGGAAGDGSAGGGAAGDGSAGGGAAGIRGLVPGSLLVSESVYRDDPGIVAGRTQLPPGCTSGCATATAGGSYPQVFNNDLVDASFGVTSRIFLTQMTPYGLPLGTVQVPGLVTSFSSKSEMALNLSPDGRYVTFMGYAAEPDTVDVSNSNTPGVIDPTNPVPSAYYRAVAQLSGSGRLRITETNAYSGNNGRAAITAEAGGHELIYTAGNAGNGGNPQPSGVILGAGAQLITPGAAPATPAPVGSFNITELGDKADKVGKDDNFRGLTLFNNVLYYTKGSGGNGVNTVYFLDTTGKACPNGVGLPAAGAQLPASPLSYDPATLQTNGLPSNMCVLKGFPTTLAKSTTDSFPFGMWFASADTLYVADEGNGTNTFSGGRYTAASAQAKAGLQKWVFDGSEWKLAYTLRAGLGLGQPYTVRGYPAGVNAATGLPWAPATDGLRNITGRVNPDGTVTIWAITSTVSGGGDQGADPNKLVEITDPLGAAVPSPGESFRTVRAAGFAEVLRGVSFAPRSR
jgi:hypothetical protein